MPKKWSIQEIKEMDPTFDFKHAHKKNHSTLINILISEVQHGPLFLCIDGHKKVLSPAQTLFVIFWREWKNSNKFSFANEIGKPHELFWTTKEAAQKWLQANFDSAEYEDLTEEQAFGIARESLRLTEQMRKTLHIDKHR